jgi:hypothetical protein
MNPDVEIQDNPNPSSTEQKNSRLSYQLNSDPLIHQRLKSIERDEGLPGWKIFYYSP